MSHTFRKVSCSTLPGSCNTRTLLVEELVAAASPEAHHIPQAAPVARSRRGTQTKSLRSAVVAVSHRWWILMHGPALYDYDIDVPDA